jgi:hypothetical protein
MTSIIPESSKARTMMNSLLLRSVIPAKAGIQLPWGHQSGTPAFAGVTDVEKSAKEVI